MFLNYLIYATKYLLASHIMRIKLILLTAETSLLNQVTLIDFQKELIARNYKVVMK